MRPTAVGALILLTGLVAAGCASPNVAEPPDENRGCPLVYPDGSPHDCADRGTTAEIHSKEAPEPTSGWFCTEVIDRGGRHTRGYSDGQGGIGVYWDWTEAFALPDFPPGGAAVAHLALFRADGEAQGFHLPLDRDNPRGYFEFPAPATSEDDMVVLNFRVFYLLENTTTGWETRDDADLLTDLFGPDGWYAWNWSASGQRHYLDIMQNASTAYVQATQPITNLDTVVDGALMNSSVWRGSARLTDFGPRNTPQMADCHI